MITIGIIGHTGHAKRLRDILECIACVKYIYHPYKKINDPKSTMLFDDLLSCDAIVIASPNDTHVSYMLKLQNYKGYVLCEKPPATNASGIEVLKSNLVHAHDKTMFNFVYRYSDIFECINNSFTSGELGKILNVSIKVSHGLAFKDSYKTSWRSDRTRHKMGVVETMGIHFIDLVQQIFNLYKLKIETIKFNSSIASSVGTAFDTSDMTIVSNHDVNAQVFVSCAAPFIFEIDVTGTNGRVLVRDGKLIVRSPRDSFDERGFFIEPPIKKCNVYEPEVEYEASLKKTLLRFVQHVEIDEKFSDTSYFDALHVCNLINYETISDDKQKDS